MKLLRVKALLKSMALCWPLKSKLPLMWHSRVWILCKRGQEVNFILNSRQVIKSNTESYAGCTWRSLKLEPFEVNCPGSKFRTSDFQWYLLAHHPGKPWPGHREGPGSTSRQIPGVGGRFLSSYPCASGFVEDNKWKKNTAWPETWSAH